MAFIGRVYSIGSLVSVCSAVLFFSVRRELHTQLNEELRVTVIRFDLLLSFF